MVVTFTTSIECYKNALGSDQPPDDSTLPTLLAIDGFRNTVCNMLKKFAGISTVAEDVDGTLAGIELEMVSAKIQSVVGNYQYYFLIADEYRQNIWASFPDVMPFGSFVLNANG